MNNGYYRTLLLRINKCNPESIVMNIAQQTSTKEYCLEHIHTLEFAKEVAKQIKIVSIRTNIPDNTIFPMAVLDATIDKIQQYE